MKEIAKEGLIKTDLSVMEERVMAWFLSHSLPGGEGRIEPWNDIQEDYHRIRCVDCGIVISLCDCEEKEKHHMEQRHRCKECSDFLVPGR